MHARTNNPFKAAHRTFSDSPRRAMNLSLDLLLGSGILLLLLVYGAGSG